MSEQPNCPECGSEYTYEDRAMYVCPECAHEWGKDGSVNSAENELIEGILLDKEKVHPSMPTQVENAKIALLDTALEIKNTEIDPYERTDDVDVTWR